MKPNNRKEVLIEVFERLKGQHRLTLKNIARELGLTRQAAHNTLVRHGFNTTFDSPILAFLKSIDCAELTFTEIHDVCVSKGLISPYKHPHLEIGWVKELMEREGIAFKRITKAEKSKYYELDLFLKSINTSELYVSEIRDLARSRNIAFPECKESFYRFLFNANAPFLRIGPPQNRGSIYSEALKFLGSFGTSSFTLDELKARLRDAGISYPKNRFNSFLRDHKIPFARKNSPDVVYAEVVEFLDALDTSALTVLEISEAIEGELGMKFKPTAIYMLARRFGFPFEKRSKAHHKHAVWIRNFN